MNTTSQLIAQANFGGGFTNHIPATSLQSKGGTGPATPLEALENFVSNLIAIMTVFGALFFIVYFVMGAFKWVAAGGESGKVQKARDQMTQGLLGMILLVSSYAIIGVIGTLVGFKVLEPATVLQTIFPAATP